MRTLLALLTLSLLTLLAPPAHAQPDLPNGDFENGDLGSVPTGWSMSPPPEVCGFIAELVPEGAHRGNACVKMSFDPALITAPEADRAGATFGNLSQHVPAAPYRGKIVEFKAWVRCQPPEDGGPCRAQLWFRVDSEGGDITSFDNMGDRPITATEWAEYTITGEVATDAKHIFIGVLHFHGGEVFVDSASFRAVGDAPPTLPLHAPAPLTDRGLANVTAFIRLTAYTRFFHPSDEAAATDWDRFTVLGLRAIEDAPDAPTLARRLRELFTPIAPTLVIVPDDQDAGPPELIPGGVTPAGMIGWVHEGVDAAPSTGMAKRYTSKRETAGLDADGPIQSPGTMVDARLPGGVRCILPVALYTDAQGRTIPSGAPAPDAEPLRLTARDRSTRLAAIGAAWGTLHHFYPYWDVVEADWDAALATALRQAATDKNEAEFLRTLRAMIAGLHDGHGSAAGPGYRGGALLPLGLAWVGDRLVVTGVLEDGAEAGIARGDVILSIGDRSAAAVRAERESLISGSPQWRAYRSAQDVARLDSMEPVALTLVRPDGTEYAAALAPGRFDPRRLEAERPRNGAELAPGVYYFNLHGSTNEELEPHLANLAAADGIVFDMRGYPNSAGIRVLSHLTDAALTSAQWEVRVTTLPDRDPAGISWDVNSWQREPMAPRFAGKVAFVTDGGAISFAETCMGIVEHHKLGEIVGSPTAGANGNVNTIALPGGYSVRYTGMKVRRHDGSQFHTIGIRPTVPVERTVEGIAAGRDELLERAVEVVSGK